MKKNYSSATGDALSGADQTLEPQEREKSAGLCSMGAVGYFLICKASTAKILCSRVGFLFQHREEHDSLCGYEFSPSPRSFSVPELLPCLRIPTMMQWLGYSFRLVRAQRQTCTH